LPKEVEISAKQKRFCEEYLIDMNGTQAAIRAGYAKKSATVQAAQMLSNIRVQKYLQKLKAEQSKRTGITADDVLREIAKIGFANIDDIVDENSGEPKMKEGVTRDQKAAISSIALKKKYTEFGVESSISVRMHDKLKALEKLGVYFGIFEDIHRALATLTQYGELMTEEDGSHAFKPSGNKKTEIPFAEDEVPAEE
jgi:phage terminase small subunit